jgi:predicted transcriptional regulator
MTDTARRKVMHTHAIRALLLGSEDGLTSGELARALGVTNSAVNAILNDAYGFYIDRWAETETKTMAAVWVCVVVPANCPRPE